MKNIVVIALAMISQIPAFAQPGTFDVTFGVNGKVITSLGGQLNELELQADGKIVAIGYLNPASTTDKFVIARYLANGAVDNSFGSGGKVQTLVGAKCGAMSGVIQPDGKIIAVGYTSDSTTNSGNGDIMVARYNPNGTLDTSFNSTGILTLPFLYSDKANAVKLQDDGRIVIGGHKNGHYMIFRLMPDGTLDTSFNTTGYNVNLTLFGYGEILDLDILEDGKILASGRQGNYFCVAKYNIDGTLDQSFGSSGVVSLYAMQGISILYNTVVLSNGDLLLAGGYMNTNVPNSKYNGALVRLTANGTPVIGFGTNGIMIKDMGAGISSQAKDVAVVGEKMIVAFSAGPTSNYDYQVTAYNSDGAIDTSFGTAGSNIFNFGYPAYHDYLQTMTVQPDGKIIVGGESAAGGFSMARLNTAVSLESEDFQSSDDTALLYPNPVTAFSRLVLDIDQPSTLTINIYNLNGELVKVLFNEVRVQPGKTEIPLNLEDVAEGTYLVEVINGAKVMSSHKVIKQAR